MSDSDAESRYFSARVDAELHDAAEFSETTKQAWLNRQLKRRVYGDEFVAAEVKNDLTDSHSDAVHSAFESCRAGIERESTNGMVTVESALDVCRRSFLPLLHALARERYEREQSMESMVTDLETGSESISPGALKTPKEAAWCLVNEQEENFVGAPVVDDGPENPGVQTQAEQCGMDPGEFFEFMVDELADVAVHGGSTSYSSPSIRSRLEEPDTLDKQGESRRALADGGHESDEEVR